MCAATAKQISRIHQSASGVWSRNDEEFPATSQLQIDLSDACYPQLDQKSKESTTEDTDAVAPAEFAQHIKEVLDAITAEWDRRQQEEKNQAAYDMLAKLVSKTTELFGANIRTYESCDPEFPEDCYLVFAVKSDMEPSDVVRAQGEWRKALSTIAPGCNSFRLLVYPK